MGLSSLSHAGLMKAVIKECILDVLDHERRLREKPAKRYIVRLTEGDRTLICTYWDKIEQGMRAYLAALKDEMLFEKPFAEGEDKDLILWQVLLHVVNHGTDHRAQLLRLLNDLGVKTGPQDYIFYVYDHP